MWVWLILNHPCSLSHEILKVVIFHLKLPYVARDVLSPFFNAFDWVSLWGSGVEQFRGWKNWLNIWSVLWRESLDSVRGNKRTYMAGTLNSFISCLWLAVFILRTLIWLYGSLILHTQRYVGRTHSLMLIFFCHDHILTMLHWVWSRCRLTSSGRLLLLGLRSLAHVVIYWAGTMRTKLSNNMLVFIAYKGTHYLGVLHA
jgi:hypothetical protein